LKLRNFRGRVPRKFLFSGCVLCDQREWPRPASLALRAIHLLRGAGCILFEKIEDFREKENGSAFRRSRIFSSVQFGKDSAAAAVAATAAIVPAAAAAAEQDDDENDDPKAAAAATIITTHSIASIAKI
jgi:hypothetical protein